MIPPETDEKEFSKKMNKIYDEYDKKIGYVNIKEFKEHSELETNTKTKKNNYDRLSAITSDIASKNSNSKFKLFKPNIASLNMLERIKSRNKNKESKGKYVPPGAKNKTSGSNTIVIKNIPTQGEFTVKEINNQLRKIFSNYGMIDRIKTLSYNENNVQVLKGIAFIDFYDPKSVDAVMEDRSTYHKIGHSILLVEKKQLN